MTELLSSVLTEITSQLIHIIGVAASPLIVLITYRAFCTRGWPTWKWKIGFGTFVLIRPNRRLKEEFTNLYFVFMVITFLFRLDSPFHKLASTFITIQGHVHTFFLYIEILRNWVPRISTSCFFTSAIYVGAIDFEEVGSRRKAMYYYMV